MESMNMSFGKSESSNSTSINGATVCKSQTTTTGTSRSDGSLDVVKRQLEVERKRIQQKTEALQSQLAALHDDAQKVTGAIAALEGKGRSKAAGSARSDEKKKQTYPSANKLQVIELILKELSESKVLSENDLLKRIETRLVEAGYTRLGFALRFKEALADSRFTTTAMGVTIKEASRG